MKQVLLMIAVVVLYGYLAIVLPADLFTSLVYISLVTVAFFIILRLFINYWRDAGLRGKQAHQAKKHTTDKRHYIHQDERQLGPFSYVELQKYLDEEVFSVKDLAAEESSDEWVPLGIYMDSLNSQLPSGHERRKFSIPKLIAIAGLVLLVAACLYPPVYSESYEGRMWIGFGGTKTIDYGPEFRYDPNWRQRNVAERQQALNEVMYGRTETVHINTQRLLIDCCIILATTVIGVTLTSRRRVRR